MSSDNNQLGTAADFAAGPSHENNQEWDYLIGAQIRDDEVRASQSKIFQIYGPLRRKEISRSFIVAHLAQSLDGKIATDSGESRWISGDEDLLHTHRMRALFDAVLVGVNTVLLDNPQLTVRLCSGSNPVRVILDPMRRLDGSQRVFLEPAARTLLLTDIARKKSTTHLGHAEIIGVEMQGSVMSPQAIISALANLGLHRIFVEGGGTTVSRFLQARALNRLQLTIAPIILGSGRPALLLPRISDLNDGLRPVTRQFKLGQDTMFECIFHE